MLYVYTSDTCPKCVYLKEYLNKAKIEFEIKNTSEDFKAKARLVAEGIMGVPVVEYKDNFFTGNVEDLINTIECELN